MANPGVHFCSHCGDFVSRATYYRHKQKRDLSSSSDSEVDIDEPVLDVAVEQDISHLIVQSDDEGEVSSDSDPDSDSDSDSNSDSDSGFELSNEDLELIGRSDSEDEEAEAIPEASSIPVPVRALILFILTWQAFFVVSEAGITLLVLFLHHFFRFLSSMEPSSTILQSFSSVWPKTLVAIRKLLKLESENFIQYVVCPSCHSIYDYDQCITESEESKECKYVAYPKHRHRSKRKPCGTLLMNKVKTKSGFKLCPKKVYCYNSLISSLKTLLLRPGFINLCEKWRHRCDGNDSEFLGDVFDGKIWKDFHSFVGEPFNLVLSLNVDWFNPFTHTTHSVGAIYLVIMNLPRSIRYKVDNIILCGLIPGPKEPPYTIGSYLSPLVDELSELWQGVALPGFGMFRAALLCTACDLPATRKLLGFASHSSHYGCSKCTVYFPHCTGEDEKKLDYSNCDWRTWVPRDMDSFKKSADKYLMCKNKKKMRDHIANGGNRYSPLISLCYFDAIRFHIVDPMHNLLLGTAKHTMETWIEKGLLNKKSFEKIQAVVSSMHAPADIGRMPCKIMSSFSGFKADQWRNWTVLFSAVALKGILPDQDLRCWLLFVMACKLLCCRVVRKQDIAVAHNYLVAFCRQFTLLYGPAFSTPNHHMHLHLIQSLYDYGPSYSFWLYSFERYNGILGKYHTNYRDVTAQIMKKFIREQEIRRTIIPNFSDDLSDVFAKMNLSCNSACSTSDEVVDLPAFLHLHSLKTAPLNNSLPDFKTSKIQHLINPIYQYVLKYEELQYLMDLFNFLCPSLTSMSSNFSFSHLCRRSSRAYTAGEVLGSQQCRSDRSSCIAAFWPLSPSQATSQLNIGFVQFFIEYNVSVSVNSSMSYIFAFVSWLKDHPNRNWYGSSVIVSSLCVHPPSMYSFIPIQRIAHKCTYGSLDVKFSHNHTERVSVAVPMDSKCFF